MKLSLHTSLCMTPLVVGSLDGTDETSAIAEAMDQNGKSYTFSGALGLAPEWEAEACGTTCQPSVSACMFAHISSAGRNSVVTVCRR